MNKGKEIRLNNASGNILRSIIEEKNIGEMQTHIFIDGIVDYIENPNLEKVSKYNDLRVRVNEMWSYREMYDKMSAEEIFLLGSIWGAIEVSDQYHRRTKDV